MGTPGNALGVYLTSRRPVVTEPMIWKFICLKLQYVAFVIWFNMIHIHESVNMWNSLYLAPASITIKSRGGGGQLGIINVLPCVYTNRCEKGIFFLKIVLQILKIAITTGLRLPSYNIYIFHFDYLQSRDFRILMI